jgi:hypothetical protein
MLLQQVFQPVLVDRRVAAVDPVDLGAVQIDAHHVVPDFGQAGTGNQADVARANDADLHQASSPSRLK